MTQYPDLFAALAAPFASHEVRVRALSGRELHYITARTAMNRLDEVLGPENWWDEYVPGPNSVMCKLTLRLPDGSTVTKGDAGGYAGMADQGDDDKSGFSDAFKRAAAKFGVARYLYRDGVPTFAKEREPESANPTISPVQPTATEVAPSRPAQDANQGDPNPPRTGRALFAWTKDQERRYQVDLLKYLNRWAKLQEFPGRMVDWNPEQVEWGYSEATRKLNAVQAELSEAQEEILAN